MPLNDVVPTCDPTAGFNNLATDADIYACYRLLLGRLPDKNGFDNFQTVIRSRQLPVAELVDMFLTSPEYLAQHQARLPGQPARVVDLQGFRMYVRPEDWAVGRLILEHGGHEPHVTTIMRQTLQPGMTFLDAGANIGYFSLMAASIVGSSGRVIAFEPGPDNGALLALSAGLNSFDDIIDLWPLGLADRSRLMVLTLQGSNGQLAPFNGTVETSGSQSVVRCVPLDQFLHLEHIHILKIDVEGSEALVVKGADEHLRRCRPIVFTEFSPPALEVISGISGAAYLRYWLDLGYRLSVIEPAGSLTMVGTDAAEVLRVFESSRSSHIDLLLQP